MQFDNTGYRNYLKNNDITKVVVDFVALSLLILIAEKNAGKILIDSFIHNTLYYRSICSSSYNTGLYRQFYRHGTTLCTRCSGWMRL